MEKNQDEKQDGLQNETRSYVIVSANRVNHLNKQDLYFLKGRIRAHYKDESFIFSIIRLFKRRNSK